MTTPQKIARRKLSLLDLAADLIGQPQIVIACADEEGREREIRTSRRAVRRAR